MQVRKLGTSGIEASAVAFGAMTIGGWLWGGADTQEAGNAVRAALDAGITLFDTAPIYGFGLSERIVGAALRGRRDEAVIATKCGMRWDATEGPFFFESEGKAIHRGLSPRSIRYELEQCLRRLTTDRIDLYQTHWQDRSTPIEDSMATLLDLKAEGKIRAIGVSNVNLRELRRYEAAGAVASIQERFSMLDRGIEAELLPECREQGIAVLAYSPLSYGLLTGKIGPDRVFGADDQRSRDKRFTPENRRRIAAMLAEFEPIARAHGLTVAQTVIAWTIAQPGVTHALCGARNAEQARENARAGDVVLAPDEIAAMDAAIARFSAAA